MRSSNERGIALITVLLVMMLMSALLVGFTAVVISDQRYRFIDQDRGRAFYGASAGVEKLTTGLGNLFFASVAPTVAQVRALTATASLPAIAGLTFVAPTAPGNLPTSSLSATNCLSPNTITTVGTNGYTIKFCAGPSGNPTAVQPPKPIRSGPYEGLVALQTPYQMDVTALTANGGEVHLVRSLESVAIPVFQFGMFSDVDLSFFAGPDFDFGGRVHTNGNLFLAQGDGATLTLTDRVTAAKEVVRQQLQNGVSIDVSASHRGTVNVAKGPGSLRALDRAEGSVVDGLDASGAGVANPTWQTTSLSAYNTWLRNGATGAKPLNLPLITVGGSNADLIDRPATSTESTTNPVLYGERLFTKASLRILLSDTAAKITSLPGVTSTTPVRLDGDWNTTPPAGYVVGLSRPPIARTIGTRSTSVLGGSSTAEYHVNSVIPFLPVMTLAGTPVTCEEKTPAGFNHCNVTVAAPTLSLVAGGRGVTPLKTSGVTAVGPNQTITLAAGSSTAAFKPSPFYSGIDLVTCTGWEWSPKRFTGCSGGAAPSTGDELTNHVLSAAGTGLIGGYIKIERQNAAGVWADVTLEILKYGIGSDNLLPAGGACGYDAANNAIVRLQRLRDNTGICDYNTVATGITDPANWLPNVLFDPREALVRDTNIAGTANLPLGGVMYYVGIDVRNLSKWFAGTGAYTTALGGTGATSRTDNGGYTLYFSDRRNNRNAAGFETGEYGWEDIVNPASSTGAPNGALDPGEDLNVRAADPTYAPVLDTYGSRPNYTDSAGTLTSVPPGAVAPLDAAARPSTLLNRPQAQVNRAILFRHALKLTNGDNIRGEGISGLTIVTENPVYIQGDWNANPSGAGGFTGAHAATSIIADAVTLLTASWNDTVSFTSPYDVNGRMNGAQSWYRVAIIAGKGMAFPRPAGTSADFGTDGGAHNFLRHLQKGNQAVNYRGSIATFYYNRQAVGTFKCCNTVYEAPDRNYAFDTDFLNPALLPPNTPVFRDMNTVAFAQELRPGR